MWSNVAALYDIHGNLPALEAVLVEAKALGVEMLVVGGDVAPGPMSEQCLRLLREQPLPTVFVRGNGDREVAELSRGGAGDAIPEPYRSASRWVAEQLSASELEFMRSWPTTRTLDVAGLGPTLFCHASPRDDAELFTVRTPEVDLFAAFTSVDEPLVICGHTHMQFDRRVGAHRVVNAGQCGHAVRVTRRVLAALGRPRRTETDRLRFRNRREQDSRVWLSDGGGVRR